MDSYQKYLLQIADNSFILSHRLSENCSKGPFLEEDLAGTNIALDLIGIAESIYEEVARIESSTVSADYLAFKRQEQEYLNCLLVEQPNKDFAYIMVRQFFMDAYNFYFFSDLIKSSDRFLAELATKSLKQLTYHLRRSSEWMLRLGDGTPEANERTQAAIDHLWKYSHELFIPSCPESQMMIANIGCNLVSVKENWNQKVNEIMYMSNLRIPESQFQLTGGKTGKHSEHFGHMLCEIQFLANKYPEAIW